MVANNLSKLKSADYKALALTGKRDEMSSWLYVFEKTLADAFGGCINRLEACLIARPQLRAGAPLACLALSRCSVVAQEAELIHRLRGRQLMISVQLAG